jgi:hypothetical protein
MFSSEYYAKS